MSANKTTRRLSSEAMVDDRRARVASYKVRGYSLRQTIVALEEDGVVNPRTGKAWSFKIVQQDVVFLRTHWREKAAQDTAEWHAEELEKIEEREREAWKAWFRGIGKKKQTLTERRMGGDKKGAGGGKTAIRAEELNGDPRFLSVLAECHRDRAKLLGLSEPERIETTGLVQVDDVSRLSEEQVVQRLEAIMAAAETRSRDPVPAEAPDSPPGGGGG